MPVDWEPIHVFYDVLRKDNVLAIKDGVKSTSDVELLREVLRRLRVGLRAIISVGVGEQSRNNQRTADHCREGEMKGGERAILLVARILEILLFGGVFLLNK